MTCPACSVALVAGQDRCPACGRIVSPPTEGALAPDPLSLTPPARGKGEPLREIPGLPKNRKERTWKDEVRERVRHRKRQRSEDEELPLFREAGEEKAPPRAAPEVPDARADPYAATVRMGREADEAIDLPIQPAEEPTLVQDLPGEDVPPAREMRLDEEPGVEWPTAPRPEESRPPERPARAGERLRAAAVDLALLLALWALVVYFASRAARVPIEGLLRAWPYLAGYLAFLGLAYAAYFTGTTGQTLGKLLGGLRVVDTAGRPPGYLRSFLRAVLGALGVALVFAGLVPIFFDPARRALHDRLLKTRVVK